MQNELSISVTTISQYVCRSGDLSGGDFNSVTAIQGTQLHRKIFASLKKEYGDKIQPEYSLSGRATFKELILNIKGRADIFIDEDNNAHIIEIKSFNSNKNTYEKLSRPEHEAQLKLYGALYLLNNLSKDGVKLTLRYVSIITLEYYDKTFEFGRAEAQNFFDKITSEYADFALKLIRYEQTSLNSISQMDFPYDTIRQGQSQFMKSALHSILAKEALFVEAPTGTGKTICALYPAIKGLLKRKYAQIYYLTAKTQTRVVATKALNDMRTKGLILRSVLLASKESMCPYGKKCDSKFCKLACGYYSRVKPAIDEALTYDEITPDLIGNIAMRNSICPHELLLDVSNYCNVVIGDYNHAFDPRVKIMRSFETGEDTVVLVDEAHNLVDRSRTMYSAEFRSSLVKELLECFQRLNPKIESYLLQLDNYFNVIWQCISSGQSAFAIVEGIENKNCMSCNLFEGTRKTPKNLYAILWKTCRFLSPFLDELPSGPTREKAMEFFFEARFFLTILEQYYDDSYITCIRIENGDVIIKLSCLDASKKLNDLIKDIMSVIFFSATMTPYEYYRNVIIGKDNDYVRSLYLPSPFDSDNLDIVIDSSISTTYKERSFTLKKLCNRILQELSGRTGNYMVFFPSFDYLNKTLKLIEENSSDIKVIYQRPNMTNIEKDNFLHEFDEPSDKVLLGAAVLGGHFGEGIDLVGDKLKGVIIVGVGIPQISPEREILSNYYSDKFGDGYSFAYRFPGWEKVLQAVGRVIRTEEDTGFALLIDDRLEKNEYLKLYPEHWKV